MRENFYAFVRYAFARTYPNDTLSDAPYVEAFCFQLERCARRRNRRLVANLPPRHLKSFALVCLQAWMLGRDPTVKVLAVSYGEDLARTFTDWFRSIVRSSWYADVFFGMRLADGGDRLDEIRTTLGGYRRSATVGGALTGFGGDIIICDDLTKAQDANSPALREQLRRFIDEVLLSRFNNQDQGVLIAVQQRLHTEDIVETLRQLTGVFHMSLPAIAASAQRFELYHDRVWERAPEDLLDPARQSRAFLDDTRLRSPLVFAAQYQQEPQLAVSSMIDMSQVRFVDSVPDWRSMLARVQFWDTAEEIAQHNDYSVGVCWGWCEGIWYLIDVWRHRLIFPRLKEFIWEFAERYKAHRIYIERASSGPQLVQQLRAEGKDHVFHRHVEMSKDVRFFSCTGFLQSHRVAILNGQSWTPDVRRELSGFPYANHDDIVDAISLFANFANSPEGDLLIATARNGWVRPRPSRPRRSRYDRFRYS